MRAIRALGGLFSAIVVVSVLILVPQAQGTISFSISGTWPAGPDYATDVLGDPWDFNNAEDVGLDPAETLGWASFGVSGGLAGGVTNTTDTSMAMLYRGRYGIINPGRTGRRFPIDTARFQKLAFKMSDSGGGQNEFPQVYWFHYPWQDPADPNGQLYGVKLLPGTVTGNQVYVTDLTTGTSGLPWINGSLPVRGLRLDPNINQAGQSIFYDWVRLTANDNASGSAMVTISWGGTGNATVNIVDAGGTALRIVNNQNLSSISWNYGVLPPGTYTVQVTRNGGNSSRQFTINAPPLVHVLDPDETGGEDYATTVLGNPWDMDGPSDVVVTGFDNYTPVPANFSGGVMSATNTNGDANVTLVHQINNGQVPIDGTKYRYLTYRYQVDGPYNLGDGSVTRILWGSQQFFQGTTATTTKDIIVWPGMNTYTVDLGALSTAADGGLETHGAAEAWTSGSKRHFRFDPHEFDPALSGADGYRSFHIDNVKLAAMDQTANDAFMITWSGGDADGGNPAIALYYDTDTNPATKTLIQSGLLMSQGSFNWNTVAVPVGTYYIYIEANDGLQTSGRYSTGTLRVVRAGATPDPAMALEAPANPSTILQPFTASGWAIDRGATSGTGVDQVQISVTSSSGATTVLGNATLFVRRDDIGAAYGPQFTNSGFTFTVSGLAPGTYTLTASAHSTVTGTFNQSRSATITLPAGNPQMAINSPPSPSTMGTPFTLAGWSIDLGDPATTGVIRVAIYSYPIDAFGTVVGGATFLGYADYGAARPDIGAAYGSRFTNSGFSLVISALPAGRHRIFAYSESKVTLSTNNQAWVDVTVGSPVSNPQMSIDGPANNSIVQQPFLTGGWAVDRGAGIGPGVDAVHVWAFPVVNGSVDAAHGIFVAQGQTGGSRPDVGYVFGSPQFANCGFTFSVQGLNPGIYELGVYARSTVTNTFNNVKFVRITIQGPQAPVSNPRMSLDGPTEGQVVSQPFVTGGWAIDLGAASGTGVDAVHVWAFPIVNGVVGAGRFVDQATLGGGRPDVAAFYGSQFQTSGFNFLMNSLTPGEYIIGIYVHSGVSGQFDPSNPNQTKFVRITVAQ